MCCVFEFLYIYIFIFLGWFSNLILFIDFFLDLNNFFGVGDYIEEEFWGLFSYFDIE